jgi:DNA-binding NarL/FixJ family response regulator
MVIEKNRATQHKVKLLLALGTRLMGEMMTDNLQNAGFEIVAKGENEADLVRLANRCSPDILLLDWALPNISMDVVRQLAGGKKYNWAVVMVGQPKVPGDVVEAVQAGARGFLSLDLRLEEFTSRLPLLAQGNIVVSRGVMTSLDLLWEIKTAPEATDGLSDREREVLALVPFGATNDEIAQELFITKNTVKVHLCHILEKLDLRNRQQLAAYAVRRGITREPCAIE